MTEPETFPCCDHCSCGQGQLTRAVHRVPCRQCEALHGRTVAEIRADLANCDRDGVPWPAAARRLLTDVPDLLARLGGDEAMTNDDVLRQTSPWPTELEGLVKRLRYKAGWEFTLYPDYLRDPATTHAGESRGLTLSILIETPDSYHPERMTRVQHLFAVPPATYNFTSWQRWLLEQILLVERHEACEFFKLHVADDPVEYVRPFAPLHGPGEDPYRIVELANDEQRRTSFRGEVK